MDYLNAFWVGGLICVLGQLLIDLTKLTPARIMVLYVTLGVALGALGLYGPLADFAGCGATVPLSGFGWALSEGVRESIGKQGFLGVFTGGVTAGAAGIAAAINIGVVKKINTAFQRRMDIGLQIVDLHAVDPHAPQSDLRGHKP